MSLEEIFHRSTAAYEPDGLLVAQLPNPMAVATIALDAGGGQGRHAVWLARNGVRVDLVDMDKVAVDQCLAAARDEDLPINAQIANLRTWSPPRRYDLVICALTLNRFSREDAMRIAEKLRKAVHPRSGLLYLTVHLAGGAEELVRREMGQPQVQERTYLDGSRLKRLFTYDEALELVYWKPKVIAVNDEPCLDEQCRFRHTVLRMLASRP